MSSPTRSLLSPTASRVTVTQQETIVHSPRSISSRSELELSIHSLQNEQERVQKKTFTKWINIYLSLHEPPFFINDLFEDLKDGTKLVALLEVLSGQTIPIERGTKRAHYVSNASNGLKFLESRKIKLVNIRPIDIVDGKPTIILGLIWMLILCYQIEDSSMFDGDSKDHRVKAKDALLEWVRKKTRGKIDGWDVKDFTSSWRDGFAFNALIYSIRPDLIDLHRISRMEVRERLENAFYVAEQHLGIPRLIDAEDVDVTKPDEKSIMTYIAQFSRRFPDLPFGSINKEHGELLRWLTDTRQRLTHAIEAPIADIQAEYKEYAKQAKEFVEKQKQWKAFERKESKSPHFPGEKLKELKDQFDDITQRMNLWRQKIDFNLPGELRPIVEWIYRAEEVLARGLNFDPATLVPDENLQRFTQLHKEHVTIFTEKETIATKFQRLKRDPSIVNQQVAIEHLNSLDERLNIIIISSDERGHYLDFEQIHWKVQIHFAQLEHLMEILNKKQGNLAQTEQLFQEYKRKIHDEKIIATIEGLLPELTRKAQNYGQLRKKDDQTSKGFNAYCECVRKTLKSAALDLKTKEHMLQETLDNWKVYLSSYDQLERWLNEGDQVLQRSSQEKLAYFANINHWAETHEKLRIAIESLMSVCDDEIVAGLHKKFLFINRRWKEIFDRVHQFEHDESIKKKRDEFYAGRSNILDTLDKIDAEIQTYLSCTVKALKEQENRLYVTQSGIDMLNDNIQALAKLSQVIARESGETYSTSEMNSILQTCFEKLRRIQEYLPLTLKRNKTMLGHLQKFEDGLQKCQQWFNEAKQLISRYSIQVPVKRIEDFLEQHRNFFAEIGYYQSLLETKGKLIQAMKKSSENLIPLDFSPVDEQYRQLVDTFEQINHQACYWEKEFSQHSQLWKDFHQRLKHLEEWIDKAQTAVKEKHEDYAYLIRKHKDFFQTINDEILHGFIKSGRELLHIRDKTEQKEIQLLMDTLENKWNTIICYAPVRLLRLQFERIEKIVVQELEQAENELNDELKQLERQHDTTEILRRHNERFQLNNFHPTMEIHMRDLQTFANDIRTKEQGQTLVSHENEQIDQRTIKLNNYWSNMQAKIDNVRRKLQTIPKKWQEFEEKFHHVESWMATIERSMTNTQNTDIPLEQYKAVVNKFKNDFQQIDTISAYTKALPLILNELIEEQATDEPARYRQRLDALLSRYKQLCVSIEETSQYCSVIIPAKLIHENSLQLNTFLTNISNVPMNFRDVSDVRSILQDQTQVYHNLQNYSQQINELVTRGQEIMKLPLVPKYVQHDVQNTQKVYNDKIQSAEELLEKLKRLLELWERFDGNKRRYQQQAERLHNEVSLLSSNRNSITSFQNEIDSCQDLRNSYAELKPLVDETGQTLQIISSNNLLPYANLQTLKTDYDNMQEDFFEKLRITEEILQDLISDNQKWIQFNDDLKRLESFFKETNAVLETKLLGERSLEDKQQLLERIRIDVAGYLHALSLLHSDGSNLETLRSKPKDLRNTLARLNQLRALAETTSNKINREEEQVVQSRTHVQTSQRYIQQLQPWIEQTESYLNNRFEQAGALNLNDAKQLLDRHKEFLEERRRMLTIFNNLRDEEHTVADQKELQLLIKSLSTRWTNIVSRSDELASIYNAQYRAWGAFDSELNAFRDGTLFDFEQRAHNIVLVDFNKLLDLNRINSLLNDIRLLVENITHHSVNYNSLMKQFNDLKQYSSQEGQRILNEEHLTIEKRWNDLNRLMTDRLRETEHLFESRKSFHSRFESFERSVRDVVEQIENHGQIQSATWNQTLQRLQQIEKQLQPVQTLLSTVGHDLAELEVAGLPKAELQTIQSTYEAHRQRLQIYENILQKRIDLLTRFEEHIRRSNELRNKLQQINDDLQQKQQLKIQDIDGIKTQIERYTTDLRAIQSESSILDRLMEESNTTITDSTTNRTIFFTVESRSVQNLIDMAENKLIQRRTQTQEINQLVEDFTQAHSNLLSRINILADNLRSSRLSGYSIHDIEDLMIIIKRLQDEIEHELDPLFKQLVRTSINSATEIEDVLQKTQIEWEKLNLEANERLYVLQRAHTLFNEIEVLEKQIETTIHNVELILSETMNSSNSFQQAKNHLKKLKQIQLDQHQSAEHDMAICQKRRDEFIGLLQSWYEMNWSSYFNLSDLQAKMRQTFEAHVPDHIKHTETICSYLQTIEKIQKELDAKVHGLDELASKMTENIDQNRFLEVVQTQRPIVANLLSQYDEQLRRLKTNCNQHNFSRLEQFRHSMNERIENFDFQINQSVENERNIQEQSSKLLSDLDSLNPLLLKLTEQRESFEKIFNETESIDNFVKLHQQIKQIQNELTSLFSSKLQRLNASIQHYTNNNIRHESTQLSTTLMNINNRYRTLSQDINRFIERIDERIESETNNSIETYRKFIEGLRVKLTRLSNDHRLTIDVKQRLLNEISQTLTNGRSYVHQAIEHIKLTRNLLNNEYNINEIDDECQAIDDEWVEFISDFDDQKQEIINIENEIKKLDLTVNDIHEWLKQQENVFQLMTTNQSTLPLKIEKLEQIKILFRNLETNIDLKQELKQLESRVSIVPLIQSYNQCMEKRQQLLSSAQDALLHASEAAEYHEHFETISERFHLWMADAENRLEQHTSTNEMRTDYAIEEHYRSVEDLINENIDGESLLSNLDDCLEQVFKTTSIEGRAQLKHILTEYQTRWSNYNIKQKQLKQMIHNVKIDRMEIDETLNEINDWITEHRFKLDELTNNLSLRDENRKRLYQLKCFSNDINVKQTLLNTLKEKILDNDRFDLIQQVLQEFQEELRVKTNELEEFVRTQILIEDSKQSIMEKLKFFMDRLSLCTKTDCDLDTLQSRLSKIEEYKIELEDLEKDFNQSYEQYQSIIEYNLNSTVKLNYQQNFEQMHLVIDNGKQTIERAILELKHLCDIWYQYEKHNKTFVSWLNQTENQLTAFIATNGDDDECTIDYLNQLSETIANKDKQLKQLEELESLVNDYDWSRQAHNTSILRERIIVLLGQCNSQLERAQQAVNFNQQWQSLLAIIHTSFGTYQEQLMEIRQEQKLLIHLDAIQNIQQSRLQCEQNMKQLETLATSGFTHSTKKESIRTQIRSLKIQLNELNELFSTIQQDLRTRSQACELVQTCIDEINQFLDSLEIHSNDNEILSLTWIQYLRNQLDQFDVKSKRLRTVDSFLSHCTTELMRSFEFMTNRFQVTRKELETFINENEIFFTRQQELDVFLVELDRHLNYLTTSYETFESIHRDNRRELDIKLDKHQQLFYSIKEFDKQIAHVRSKIYEAGLRSSLEESVQKRLQHLEQDSSLLQEKAMQTFTYITTIKFECEQLVADIKQMNDWLKLTDQQLNKYLIINLSTAEEKNDAAKRMLEKLDDFAIQEAHREQMKQRSDGLCKTLDDAPLQASLDDLDQTFSALKQQIQHRYETLNRAAHHHADYDLRLNSLFETLSTLQTTFHHIRQQEIHADILHQLRHFKTERDDFEEGLRRISYNNEQILSETSIEGSEHLKLKLKQLQTKWRTLNNDIQSFEEKLARQDEEQRLVLNEQTTIEQTLNNIQQQLQTFDQQFLNDYTTSDLVRQRLQHMTNTLSSVEKFHLHLLSPSSSTDTTVIERAQHLSSFHEQLKTSTQKKLNELNHIERYSNEIISCQQTLQNLVDACSIRLQTFHGEKSRNEIYIKRIITAFEDHRNRLNDLVVKAKDLKKHLHEECLSKELVKMLMDKIDQMIVDAERCSINLIQTVNECQHLQELIEEQRESIQHIQQSLIMIEQTIDGFMLKHSIEEKILQKEELKHLQEDCLECGSRLVQINVRLVDNHIDDGQMVMITSETKRKCDELVQNIEHLLLSCDEIIIKQTTFDETYNDVRKSIESLHEKYQSSLELDSGVAELSALLSECDSLRDRLDFMTSSYNTIDTQLRTRRSSMTTTTTTTTSPTSNNNSLLLSPSVHNHTMKAMLQQTKDEFNRLVQTLRSSKQTIESKQQRLQTLNKQLNDIEHEYELIIVKTKLPDIEEIIKDDQYEYKDECQRKRLLIQDIEPKQNRLQTITNEANDLNDLQLATNGKRLINQFDRLRRDLSAHLDESERRYEILLKFTNDCSVLQQSLQTIQNQLSPISDTYGDKEILEDKMKKLMDVKNNYRELTSSLQDIEQMTSQVLTLVGQNGKQSIRREWERVQVKSHQINTTILKIEQQLQNCITDWLTFLKESEQLSYELTDLESSLKMMNIRVQNDGQTPVEILRNMKSDLDLIESKLNSLNRFATDLSQRTQETDLLEHLQQLQAFIQRLKLLLKDLLRKATDGQTKYSLYSQQMHTYNQLLDECELHLNKIIDDVDVWNDNKKSLSAETIQTTSNVLESLINNQPVVQRQANLLNEVTESLIDSVENPHFFRQRCVTMQTRQTHIFQRANTIENQLDNLLQHTNDIKRLAMKITESHTNVERKLKQINDLVVITNADEKQERLIRIQTELEILHENDGHLRELADMIDRLQPKISEFLSDFERINVKQEQLNDEAKALEDKYRSEYGSLKQWIEIQQKLEHILTKTTKDYEQTTQYHTLLQLDEFSKNLTLNLNKHEYIENLLQEARLAIESLDQSSQDNIIRSVQQYHLRWNDLREHLNKCLQETEKIRNQTQNLIQDSDIHFKECLHFIATLTDIRNDSVQISNDKLEKLKTEHVKILDSLTLTIENNLSIAKDLSLILSSEPRLRHQMEQLTQMRNKLKEQFNLTIQQFEELVERFNFAINEHDILEKRLTTILGDIERCSNLTGDNFTSQTRQYLNEYQTIQRSIIIDLQKLSDHNLLLSSDVKATEYLQERYNNLKEIHLSLEQKVNHLRERINVSLSINVKIDDNIRQIKRTLILYETDLNHLRTEIPNSVSDKRIRAELAVTVYNDLQNVGNLLEELIHDAERECETSTENILALSEIKIQHEQMLCEFKEQVDNSNLIFNEHFNYGESARTLRSFIADVTTELCNLDKQPISTIEKTRELIE
ncbi:unnamed protein product, partial [Rotaria magnacalcarata]